MAPVIGAVHRPRVHLAVSSDEMLRMYCRKGACIEVPSTDLQQAMQEFPSGPGVVWYWKDKRVVLRDDICVSVVFDVGVRFVRQQIDWGTHGTAKLSLQSTTIGVWSAGDDELMFVEPLTLDYARLGIRHSGSVYAKLWNAMVAEFDRYARTR